MLRWWLTKLVETGQEDIRKLSSGFLTTDFGLENGDLVEVVKELGICNSADVTGDNLVKLEYFSRFKVFRLRVWKYDKDKAVENLDKVSGHYL